MAVTLFIVEFIADKIPYVDSAWDALHTFIRPPAAAVLAYSAYGSVPEEWKLGAEPVSNWALSILEDGLSVFLVWMAARYPLLTAVIVLVLLVVAVLVIRKLWRLARQIIDRLRRPQPSNPA